MRTADINVAILTIAAQNHGLVSVRLAAESGIPSDALEARARNGMLQRVDRCVYRLAGTPSTWEQRALLATWSAAETAVLSHRAGAMLWGLDGITHAPLEVLVPRWARRRKRVNVKVHETLAFTEADRTVRHGIPAASIERVLLDLPAVTALERADQAWEDALRKRFTSVDRVAHRFAQLARRGRPGTQASRMLLEARTGTSVPTMSEFERQVDSLLVGAGVDRPARQHPVQLPDGTVVFIDLAWPHALLGLECDGLFDHGTNIRLFWDDTRQNALQLMGWLILRTTWQQLRSNPERIIQDVKAGLRRPAIVA